MHFRWWFFLVFVRNNPSKWKWTLCRHKPNNSIISFGALDFAANKNCTNKKRTERAKEVLEYISLCVRIVKWHCSFAWRDNLQKHWIHLFGNIVCPATGDAPHILNAEIVLAGLRVFVWCLPSFDSNFDRKRCWIFKEKAKMIFPSPREKFSRIIVSATIRRKNKIHRKTESRRRLP